MWLLVGTHLVVWLLDTIQLAVWMLVITDFAMWLGNYIHGNVLSGLLHTW